MSTAIADAWERYATSGRTPRREKNAAGQSTWFNWTSHADHGPDETALGPVGGRRVLELGCGTGCNLAHLATLGAHGTGVDVSPTQVDKARARWGHLGIEFTTGEAVDYLADGREQFDVIYSVFGAHWFTDPAKLLPPARKRLRPGGVYAFSHTAPADVAPPAPKALIPRYDLDPATWGALLLDHGFQDAHVQLVPPPTEGGHRTLFATARA
ncbi:class I SAM-dependent methyltransferase [Streptacidiphilus sp. MAP5-3]|uniref:class I SAM-dependent methyltransferase n=1 Tax=unclassified Streptacidiphilus TaxID=2643834 RepID=UPI0035153A95